MKKCNTGNGKKKNEGKTNHKYNRETPLTLTNNKLYKMAETYRSQIQPVCLDDLYTPNTKTHQSIWVKSGKEVSNAFIPRISDDDVCSIMALDVDNDKKILLLFFFVFFGFYVCKSRNRFISVK